MKRLVLLFSFPLLFAACGGGEQQEAEMEHPTVEERIESFSDVDIEVDLDRLTERQRLVIAKLVEAGKIADEIDAVFDAFAESGPTPEEFEQAQAQVAKTLGEAFEEPSFWALQLSQLEKRDRDLDDLTNALEAYASFTADDVTETYRRYHERPKVRVIVKPLPDKD